MCQQAGHVKYLAWHRKPLAKPAATPSGRKSKLLGTEKPHDIRVAEENVESIEQIPDLYKFF